MTQPPRGSAVPPASPPAAPSVPHQAGPAAPGASAAGPSATGATAPAPPRPPAPQTEPAVPPSPRRTAFAEGLDQLRKATVTEPGRLRMIGAALAVLVLAFGVLTAWQTNDRATAADNVLHHSHPLSAAAADIYDALADANTAASSAFLTSGQEQDAADERYEKDIRKAAQGLVKAAAGSEPGSPAAKTVARLNELLPRYKGLVERARANNRLGYPLGGAYLRYANSVMQEMLPAAEDLNFSENQRLRADYEDATPYPWAAIGLGVLTLAALGWAQVRNYRRTNRVLNRGLVTSTTAACVVLVWLVVGQSVARAGLQDSYDHGIRSLEVLTDARIASLKARSNENLTLVNRGAETTEVKGEFEDKFDVDFQNSMKVLDAELFRAGELADDNAGERPVTSANGWMKQWRARHADAREADDKGDYGTALKRVVGSSEDKPTRECFDAIDRQLRTALDHEETQFRQAAAGGLGALSGLAVGAGVLAALATAAALLGIGRRLSEYR